ncbi:MAG: hypothetical protein WAO52_18130 [Prolixibacteraceae bacterium]
MFLNSLLALTSISQWALFAGIGFIIFGWIEKQEKFVWAGLLVFLLMGMAAAYFLLSGTLPVSQNGGEHLPKELKVYAYVRGIAFFSVLTGISLLMKIFKIKFQVYTIYLILFFALVLFFMVFNIQQMPN